MNLARSVVVVGELRAITPGLENARINRKTGFMIGKSRGWIEQRLHQKSLTAVTP
jgi:hypothetical protein